MTDSGGSSNINLEIYKERHAHELLLNKETAEFERATLAPLFQLNGGAVVAFLTLLGALWDKQPPGPPFTLVSLALGAWMVGLLLASLATAAGYFSQRGFAIWARTERTSPEERLLAIAASPAPASATLIDAAKKNQKLAYWFGAGSLAFFIVGAVFALLAVAKPDANAGVV